MAVQLSSSYLRRSYQLLATLCPQKETKDQAFEHASDIIFEWARKKFSRIFRQMPFQKTSFADKRDGNEVGIIYRSEKGLFVFRCAHPDARIPGRMWITDVDLRKVNTEYFFAVRLSVTSLQSCTEDVPFSRPAFVGEIIDNIGISDVIRLSSDPHQISTKEDVESFVELLANESRRMPIVLLTQCHQVEDGAFDGYMFNASLLAKDLSGVAHVFCIEGDSNEYLTQTIGKTWSAFNGAVRTYYPNLSFEESDCFQHPLLTQQSIRLRNSIATDAPNFCMYQIEDYVKNYALTQRIQWEEGKIDFYLSCYQKQLSEERAASTQSRHQLIFSYEEQLKQLQKQSDENFALADSYAKDLEACQEENSQQRKLISQLKAQITTLRFQLQNATGDSMKENVPDAGTYSEINDWISKYYPDRIYLHPRAIRSLKTAVYEDPKLVYKCLKLLATAYYDYQTGVITYSAFSDMCKEVDPALDERGAITDTAAGMQGDTYYVQYHGKKRKLERHLAKGSNKDCRYCLRIYFFWDDQEQMVVVGDLPHHLDTSAT